MVGVFLLCENRRCSFHVLQHLASPRPIPYTVSSAGICQGLRLMPAALAVKFLQSEWDREAVSGLKHRWSGGGGGSRTRVRESLPSKGYVRFRFGGCRPPHRIPARRNGLARLNPAFGSRRKPWTYSCKMTPSDQVQAHRPRTAT